MLGLPSLPWIKVRTRARLGRDDGKAYLGWYQLPFGAVCCESYDGPSWYGFIGRWYALSLALPKALLGTAARAALRRGQKIH